MADDPLAVLLVDDDLETQRILQLVAGFYGGILAVAQDAESVLNYLENHRPDVILVDIFLENVNGYQILQLIRQSTFNPQCPIVATTAYFTPVTASMSILNGFDGYVEKPLKVEGLWPYFEDLTHRARRA